MEWEYWSKILKPALHYPGSSLSHSLRVNRLAAVDDERMACYKRCFVGDEKQHAVSDLFRTTHAEERFVAVSHKFPLFVSHSFTECRPWRKTPEAWCFDGAGADAVDA